MNAWAIKGSASGFVSISLVSEEDAWKQAVRNGIIISKPTKYTCVPVTVQESAQASLEQRMRDDVAALGPVEALRRIKETESAQAGSGEAHVATVAEVHMSRYTLEWNGRSFPEGTKLYASQPASADEGMASVLRECLPYVKSQADAEHMLDGFGPKSVQPTDSLLKRINDLLAARKS